MAITMLDILASSVEHVFPFPPYGSGDIPTYYWLQMRLQQRIFTVFPTNTYSLFHGQSVLHIIRSVLSFQANNSIIGPCLSSRI